MPGGAKVLGGACSILSQLTMDRTILQLGARGAPDPVRAGCGGPDARMVERRAAGAAGSFGSLYRQRFGAGRDYHAAQALRERLAARAGAWPPRIAQVFQSVDGRTYLIHSQTSRRRGRCGCRRGRRRGGDGANRMRKARDGRATILRFEPGGCRSTASRADGAAGVCSGNLSQANCRQWWRLDGRAWRWAGRVTVLWAWATAAEL